MSKSKTTQPPPAHAEVNFERSDIETGPVFWSGVAMGTITLVVAGATLAFGLFMAAQPPRRQTDLPVAYADTQVKAPPIPLESLEDIRDGKPRLLPPRAADYFTGQRAQLESGKGEALPIETAIKDVANRLKSRKDRVTSFSVPLPSKGSSGTTATGGP